MAEIAHAPRLILGKFEVLRWESTAAALLPLRAGPIGSALAGHLITLHVLGYAGAGLGGCGWSWPLVRRLRGRTRCRPVLGCRDGRLVACWDGPLPGWPTPDQPPWAECNGYTDTLTLDLGL